MTQVQRKKRARLANKKNLRKQATSALALATIIGATGMAPIVQAQTTDAPQSEIVEVKELDTATPVEKGNDAVAQPAAQVAPVTEVKAQGEVEVVDPSVPAAPDTAMVVAENDRNLTAGPQNQAGNFAVEAGNIMLNEEPRLIESPDQPEKAKIRQELDELKQSTRDELDKIVEEVLNTSGKGNEEAVKNEREQRLQFLEGMFADIFGSLEDALDLDHIKEDAESRCQNFLAQSRNHINIVAKQEKRDRPGLDGIIEIVPEDHQENLTVDQVTQYIKNLITEKQNEMNRLGVKYSEKVPTKKEQIHDVVEQLKKLLQIKLDEYIQRLAEKPEELELVRAKYSAQAKAKSIFSDLEIELKTIAHAAGFNKEELDPKVDRPNEGEKDKNQSPDQEGPDAGEKPKTEKEADKATKLETLRLELLAELLKKADEVRDLAAGTSIEKKISDDLKKELDSLKDKKTEAELKDAHEKASKNIDFLKEQAEIARKALGENLIPTPDQQDEFEEEDEIPETLEEVEALRKELYEKLQEQAAEVERLAKGTKNFELTKKNLQVHLDSLSKKTIEGWDDPATKADLYFAYKYAHRNIEGIKQDVKAEIAKNKPQSEAPQTPEANKPKEENPGQKEENGSEVSIEELKKQYSKELEKAANDALAKAKHSEEIQAYIRKKQSDFNTRIASASTKEHLDEDLREIKREIEVVVEFLQEELETAREKYKTELQEKVAEVAKLAPKTNNPDMLLQNLNAQLESLNAPQTLLDLNAKRKEVEQNIQSLKATAEKEIMDKEQKNPQAETPKENGKDKEETPKEPEGEKPQADDSTPKVPEENDPKVDQPNEGDHDKKPAPDQEVPDAGEKPNPKDEADKAAKLEALRVELLDGLLKKAEEVKEIAAGTSIEKKISDDLKNEVDSLKDKKTEAELREAHEKASKNIDFLKKQAEIARKELGENLIPTPDQQDEFEEEDETPENPEEVEALRKELQAKLQKKADEVEKLAKGTKNFDRTKQNLQVHLDSLNKKMLEEGDDPVTKAELENDYKKALRNIEAIKQNVEDEIAQEKPQSEDPQTPEAPKEKDPKVEQPKEESPKVPESPKTQVPQVAPQADAKPTLEIREERLPFQTKVIEDNTIPMGTEVEDQKGEEGILQIGMVDGKEVVRNVTKSPVDCIVRRGTKKVMEEPKIPDAEKPKEDAPTPESPKTQVPQVAPQADAKPTLKIREERLPFQTKVIEDNTIPMGTEVEDQKGEEGILQIGMVDGKEVVRNVTKSPVDRIVRRGTKKVEEEPKDRQDTPKAPDTNTPKAQDPKVQEPMDKEPKQDPKADKPSMDDKKPESQADQSTMPAVPGLQKTVKPKEATSNTGLPKTGEAKNWWTFAGMFALLAALYLFFKKQILRFFE